MKVKNLLIFLLVLALVGGLVYTSIYGLDFGKFKLASISESMKLGLDLEGGVLVVLEANTDETGTDLDRKVEEAKNIISNRVNELGLTEPIIVKEGSKRIRIELPGVENTQEALDMIGQTAKLEFITLDTALPEDFVSLTIQQKLIFLESLPKEERIKFFDEHGKVIFTGENVKDSELTYDRNNLPAVGLEFDKEGGDIFYEITKELSSKPLGENILYIVLDDNVISAPGVSITIPDGKSSITGNFTLSEASNLAALIRGGALPVEMVEVESSVIGPTLGLESLEKSVFAAMIGLLLIFLFMIIYYRIPGFISSISLMIYIVLVLGIMTSLNATLTLPGVAGLILSIGMAVDANVVIFERIKEELKVGKTLRSAVDAGFKKAITTVLDANITTLIAGLVLFKFGTGPIKGFAVTLMIGLFASLFTAIFITKFILKLVIGMNITKNTKLYGA